MHETRTTVNENRAYTLDHSAPAIPWMVKHANNAIGDFGKQLAALRKTAGYTQQQLADECGVSRRVITYYETESPHPPANLWWTWPTRLMSAPMSSSGSNAPKANLSSGAGSSAGFDRLSSSGRARGSKSSRSLRPSG